ncbi:hypothetical protein BJY01DRAFT_250473 [Aspergillus pseudoustus]|uniref:Transmembrane protein n=1 Tax=Aspergillus pseudoustus TaxID=1810923 RepID=A0ABR4JIX6_9EURO
MEQQAGQSNSTKLIHGQGHHHLPDLDRTKTSDEVIILILGAIVFLTFALGFAFQLNDKPVWFLRRAHPVWEEDDDNDNDFVGQVHQMAELDLETAATTATVTDPLLFKSEVDGDGADMQFPPTRWAARYGAITQHHVDVGGVRKMVLVVEGDVTSLGAGAGADEVAAGPSIQDSYTAWFERWRGRNERGSGKVGGGETGERASDDGDNLLDEDDVTLLDSAFDEAAVFGESLLQLDPEEDEDEEEVWQSAPSQRNSM